MQLINIVAEEFGIKPAKNIRIMGTAVGAKGPNQMMFIIPIKGGETEPEPGRWGILPTTSNKPQLVANAADPGGAVLRVSTLNRRTGKRIGRIYIRERDLGHVTCVGYGIAGDEQGNVTWEEAVLWVHGPTLTLYLVNVGPPNEFLVYTEGEEVQRIPAEADAPEFEQDDYIRIDDPRVRRWKAPEEYAQS